MNIGRWQILFWPRRCLWFCYSIKTHPGWITYQYLYHFIVYVWPIEIRRFRVIAPSKELVGAFKRDQERFDDI